MPVVAVVGAQWGDEGKGKIVDLLAEKADVVARYQGGNNAGHTVINQFGEFRLHLVPAGIFDPKVTCIIGNGVVIDPEALTEEIDALVERGVSVANLCLSERAHAIMPYHVLLDRLEEEARGQKSIGTTGRGVGPAYADKVGRAGIRLGELIDPALLRDKLGFVLEQKNRIMTRLYGADPLPFQQVYEHCLAFGSRLAPHVKDTTQMLQRAIADGRNILLEGAQGTLLDLDFGTYPYVTSSSPTSGSACSGLGLAPSQIDGALGVFKAYQTRVGSGPFPTELHDETCTAIRERGQEYGTLTGRARRIGWFDGTLARFSARLNGFTSLAVTRLDILDELPKLKICVKYRRQGVEYEVPPLDLADCEPVYEEHPGWQMSTGGARRFEDLPVAAQAYVKRLSEIVGARLDIVSVGANRDQTIILRSPL